MGHHQGSQTGVTHHQRPPPKLTPRVPPRANQRLLEISELPRSNSSPRVSGITTKGCQITTKGHPQGLPPKVTTRVLTEKHRQRVSKLLPPTKFTTKVSGTTKGCRYGSPPKVTTGHDHQTIPELHQGSPPRVIRVASKGHLQNSPIGLQEIPRVVSKGHHQKSQQGHHHQRFSEFHQGSPPRVTGVATS